MKNNKIHHDDPIQRNVEKSTSDLELSPMDPPDAYSPPGKIDITIEDMHPFLQELMRDHEAIKEALTNFEETILSIKEEGIKKHTNERLKTFFEFFNDEFIAHDRREEKLLFPALAEKLLENGEHSKGHMPTTSVDVMEDDHLKATQLASVIFNFFALAARLRDDRSRCLVLDAALNKSHELIELLRLHIFREDTIVFPLAHKYLAAGELNRMEQKGSKHVHQH